MSNNTPTPNDANLTKAERWISTILRGGVLLSVVLIIAGAIVSFVHHPAYLHDSAELKRLVEPGAAFPKTLRDVAAGLAQGDGRALAVVGLLVLILTPVLRVAISVLAFLEQRDIPFALITATVLTLLIISLMIGGVE